MAPCGWDPILTSCTSGPCRLGADEFPTDIAATAIEVATSLIWMLSGRQFGACEITVRPCKPKTCNPLSLSDIIYFDRAGSGNLGVGMGYTPTLIDGGVYNIACGCNQGCCTCEADCEVYLPGPVNAVSEVMVDGVVVDPDTYFVLDGNRLVFIQDCPPCQNYNLPAGEVGTWTVTYSRGVPVPAALNLAAGLYACELGRALSGQDCALPSRVTGVARPGVDIQFVDPAVLADAGLTGMPEVDAILRAVNPDKLREPSSVWSPDLRKSRRQS